MVISEIRSLYRDENDLFRTVTKRIYEQWNAQLQQWDLRRIEFIFEDPDFSPAMSTSRYVQRKLLMRVVWARVFGELWYLIG